MQTVVHCFILCLVLSTCVSATKQDNISLSIKSDSITSKPDTPDNGEYKYEEKEEYTLKCEAHHNHTLHWQVDQFNITSTEVYDKSISMRFKLDRYDDGLKISCVCDSTQIKTLAFSLKYYKKDKNTIKTLKISDGTPREEHCVILYSNLTSKYIMDSTKLTTKIKTKHDGTQLTCAKLQLEPNGTTNVLTIEKHLLEVTSRNQNDRDSEDATLYNINEDRGKNQVEVGEADEKNTSREHSSRSFPVLQVVGGAIALTVLFAATLVFIYLKRRRENLEPNNGEVIYAEVQMNNNFDSFPKKEEIPYATIIGVLAKKQGKKMQANQPTLPPRNEQTVNSD